MRVSKRLAIVLVAILVCLIGPVLFIIVRIIPPSCGRVVDAITGQPVGDLSVLLQISTIEGQGLHTEVSHRTSTTESGWFLLLGSFRWNTPSLQHSWLTLNAEQSGHVVGEEGSAAFEVQYDPMFNLLRNEPVGNKRYFPLAVTFRRDGCARVWDAACVYRRFWLGFSIPLIPVLNDVEDCRKIKDSSLRERCRQLNTYRAAFVHVDTYEEVRKGKELCNQLNSAELCKTCLNRLAYYIAIPDFDRPIKSRDNEPISNGMFPDTVAGLSVEKNKRCSPRDVFSGLVVCHSGYGTGARESVGVDVLAFPGVTQSEKATYWKQQYSTDQDLSYASIETRAGGQVLRSRGPVCNSFFWPSGDKRVRVFFYEPLQAQERFLSYYLKQFPSTLRNE